MHIVLIAGSNRSQSQSTRIAAIVAGELAAREALTHDTVDLHQIQLPFWDETKDDASPPWDQVWVPVRDRFAQADGFVFIVPEWNGMVPPQVKNLFLLTNGQFAHKPAMIIGVSAGVGGAYPAAELRMTSAKNSHICWIPEQLILRGVRTFEPVDEPRTMDRMRYGLDMLVAYAGALAPIREDIMDLDTYRSGP